MLTVSISLDMKSVSLFDVQLKSIQASYVMFEAHPVHSLTCPKLTESVWNSWDFYPWNCLVASLKGKCAEIFFFTVLLFFFIFFYIKDKI